MKEKNNIVIYQLEDGKTKIDVKLDSTVKEFLTVQKEENKKFYMLEL